METNQSCTGIFNGTFRTRQAPWIRLETRCILTHGQNIKKLLELCFYLRDGSRHPGTNLRQAWATAHCALGPTKNASSARAAPAAKTQAKAFLTTLIQTGTRLILSFVLFILLILLLLILSVLFALSLLSCYTLSSLCYLTLLISFL